MKKISILCLLLLTGCVSHEEIIQKIQEEYSGLNCEQLKSEHASLTKMKEEAVEAENLMAGLNLAVGLISIFGGGNGSIGGTGSEGNAKINEYNLKLEAISGLMQQKKCNEPIQQ